MIKKAIEKRNLHAWISGVILTAFLLAAGFLPGIAQEAPPISVDQVFARYALFNRFLVKNGSIRANWLNDGNAFWYGEEAAAGRTFFQARTSGSKDRYLLGLGRDHRQAAAKRIEAIQISN